MQLVGMSDEAYQKILAEVDAIRFLIVVGGGMATKTKVENVLMARHELDRSDAHTFVNLAEGENNRAFSMLARGTVWNGPTTPTLDDFPELAT
jgi:hypothetical protein